MQSVLAFLRCTSNNHRHLQPNHGSHTEGAILTASPTRMCSHSSCELCHGRLGQCLRGLTGDLLTLHFPNLPHVSSRSVNPHGSLFPGVISKSMICMGLGFLDFTLLIQILTCHWREQEGTFGIIWIIWKLPSMVGILHIFHAHSVPLTPKASFPSSV